MATSRDQEIKEAVRERYSEVARGAIGCCDSSCCAQESALYTGEETEGVPSEAVMASAGCGNPTALASLAPGETVVDLGSGGGIDCFLAARTVGPTGRVIGVDMTPEMVRLAKSNARKLGLSNVEFHLVEIERTPIPDDSVDVIISNCVICLAPDKDAVFREAFRILRPGGRLFVSDMVLVGELPAEVVADVEAWVSCLGGGESQTVYLQRLSRAGFVDVEIASSDPLNNQEGWMSVVRSMSVKALKPG